VSFVQLLACGIATWAAVFIVDMAMRRGYNRACLESSGLLPKSHPTQLAASGGGRLTALIAWLAGTVVGLLFTASPLFTGPLVVGILPRAASATSLAAPPAPACTQCSAGTSTAKARSHIRSVRPVRMRP
jgi:purine-cytosine permease-like protein